MKKLHLLKTMLLLCALIVGSGTMWAASFTGTFRKCTGTITSGTYVILEKGKTQGPNNTIAATWITLITGVSVSDGVITNPDALAVWDFDADTGYLKGNGKTAYIYYDGGGNEGAVSSTQHSKNVIKETATSGDYIIYYNNDNSGRMLKVNSTSGYRFYTSSSTFNLYKLEAAKTTTSLSISPNPLNLTYGGGTGSLTATVTPDDEDPLVSPAITWEVTGTSGIASVDENGVVTPLAEGSTEITATYNGDNTYNGSSNTVTVKVTDNRTAVATASKDAYIWFQKTLYVGQTAAFTPTDITLADGLDEEDVTYSYVSADPSTIQITDGTFTVLKTGNNIDVTLTITPNNTTDYKPSSFTFQHTGAYRYSKPVFTPTGVTEGNFSGSMTLEMANDGTPTGPIYYTTDGTEPETDLSNCTLYESALTLTNTTTVKARVIDTNGLYSTVTTATYTKVPANKDAITLAAGQSLSFTSFSNADGYADHVTENVKTVYFLSSDGDNYKFTGVDFGSFNNNNYRLQLKSTTGTMTSGAITSTNGFKMTLTVHNSNNASVDVYVGETKKTAVDGAYYFSSGDAVTIKRSSGTPQISNITFTGLKPSRSITFPDGDQTITVDGSTITKTATVSPAGTATYSSSNTAVATVNSETGEVTAVKGGTAVITATVAADDDYEKSTGSYTVIVNKAATTLAFTNDVETVELVDGTATFTATATPADGSRTITYSSDDITVNSSTGQVTLTETGDFTIKANATATDKYLAPSEASYTLHVQDGRVAIVDASKLTLGLTDVLDAPIALDGVQKDDEGFLAASYTLATGFSGTEVVTYSSSDATVFKIENGNEFTALKGGTATVTVTITSGGNKMFTTVEKEFTVTVTNPSKTATEITVTPSTTPINATYGTPVNLTVSITDGYTAEGTIENALSNDKIVEVAVAGTAVTITPKAIGTTTLTFSADETANFKAAENVVLTINVAAPTAQTSTGTVDGTVEDLDFSKDDVPNTWTMTTTNANDYQAWTDNSSANYISANGYYNKNRYAGTYDYITDEYDLTRYSTANLEFEHAGQYFNTIPDGIKLYAEVDDEEQELTINTYFAGTSYSTYVKNTTSINALCGKKAKIIFRYISDGANTNTGRWDIKNFKISGKTLPSETVTVASSGFSTHCYQYPLDLDLLDEDVKAYIVTSVEGTNVTFKRITGTIKGGVPFILYGTDEEHTLYTAASSTTVPEGNMLVGTLAPTYITATNGDYTNFGLKGGYFVKAKDGVIGANKAYLPVLTSSLSTGDAHEFGITFIDETTGISKFSRETVNDNRYYNLNGQRVENPMKGGLYIQNGRKVVVK